MTNPTSLPPILAPQSQRLPPIASLLGASSPEPEAVFAQPAPCLQLPHGALTTLFSDPWRAIAPEPEPRMPAADAPTQLVVDCLFWALQREQLKTQALQAQMMHSAMAQSPMFHAFDNANREEAWSDRMYVHAGEKRRRTSIQDEPGTFLTGQRKRVHVRSACLSCKASHIACDDRQPCRNCVRRGCKCERVVSTAKKPATSCADALKSAISKASAAIASSTGRKYVKAACACCHKSHLACDEFRPCRNCVRLGLQSQCTWESKKEVSKSGAASAGTDRHEECPSNTDSAASTAAASPEHAPASPADSAGRKSPLDAGANVNDRRE